MMNSLKVTLAFTAVLAVLAPAALAARVAPLTSATLGGGMPKPMEVVNQIKLVTSDEAASTTAEAGAAAATTDGELDAEVRRPGERKNTTGGSTSLGLPRPRFHK